MILGLETVESVGSLFSGRHSSSLSVCCAWLELVLDVTCETLESDEMMGECMSTFERGTAVDVDVDAPVSVLPAAVLLGDDVKDGCDVDDDVKDGCDVDDDVKDGCDVDDDVKDGCDVDDDVKDGACELTRCALVVEKSTDCALAIDEVVGLVDALTKCVYVDDAADDFANEMVGVTQVGTETQVNKERPSKLADKFEMAD
jgi:hypothetical protein